jgi:TRAP-type uncharacterized transport system substrate-binding protein
MRQSLWHSVALVLSIDVFRVHTTPGRVVAAAYAFVVLILTSTYTANLAAFLTKERLDTGITNIDDLRGKAVVTVPTYQDALLNQFSILASTGSNSTGVWCCCCW